MAANLRITLAGVGRTKYVIPVADGIEPYTPAVANEVNHV